MPSLGNLAASPDGRNVYATGLMTGSFGVATLRRDPVSGALTDGGCVTANPAPPCSTTFTLLGAQASAVSPDGRNVYTTTNGMAPGTAGGVIAFARDPGSGELTKVGCTGNLNGCEDRDLALAGSTAVAIPPDGRHVYVAAQGRLITLARGQNGTLTRVDCAGATDGCARDPDLSACRSKPPGACRTQGGYVANRLVFSADSQRLYMASNRPLPQVFSRAGDSGRLTALPEPSCSLLEVNLCVAQLTSEGLAVSRDGRDVYSTLSLFAGNASVRPLPAIIRSRPLVSSPLLVPWGCLGGNLPVPCPDAGPADILGDLAMAPDDGAVYASFSKLLTIRDGPQMGPAPAGVAVLARNADNGALSVASCVSSDGSNGRCVQGSGFDEARSLLVSPDGRNVYLAGSGQIAVLGPAVAMPARNVAFSRAGRARVRLSCPAVARARCRGQIVLASASGARTLAARRFSIGPGKRARVALALSRRGGRALRPGRRIKGQVRLRAGGRVSGRSTRLVSLRRARQR